MTLISNFFPFSIVCTSAGPHYNPKNATHGDILSNNRHVGDLGNVDANGDGTIVATISDSVIQLNGPYSVIGRSVVLHALTDDLGMQNNSASLSTGNSGARIACGVVFLNSIL